MRVFWEHGYEGASLTDLTQAMGINRTSMYAAFGNKEELFRKVLNHYTEGPASYGAEALAEPTALGVATVYINGTLRSATMPDYPAGCLGLQASLVSGEDARVIRDLLAAWRDENRTLLIDRFRQAAAAGDLPPATDPELLARYVMTVSNGIAVQAAGGATRADLQPIVDAALRNWPPV
ncbi:TetR/AcrR family transcriptional regulator [Actinoplanes sp. LDG1-06]|uniref:TetR/AcrR family transcriptional regulator n=2 Tax=Paractinoplanes ovalisporus TaxID=2810368 RepID=A0ABS2ATP3_9ACTN|nr:TetR/AcrR family transcriptional regulator [Actinoplanes ovalisporus]